jgi:hypothetical protein
MIFAGSIFQFFTSGLGRWLGTAAVVGVAALSWRMGDLAKQRAVGAERVMAKVERANSDAIAKARKARAAAASDRPSGVRDPNTVAD